MKKTTRLSFKTSDFGSKVMVRKFGDVHSPETVCTPFCEVSRFDKGHGRWYLTLAVDADSDFDAYLRSINEQILGFLGPGRTIIMPYDVNKRALRVKLPLHGGRPAVHVYAVSTLDELPTSALDVGKQVALQMVLHDIWLGDEIMPTWAATKALVGS